jgi:thiosulfate dehydrogenase (quinone) large subunit
MSFSNASRSDFTIAYALARVGFGINLFSRELSRIGGIPAFAESLRTMFAKTWLPLPLVTGAGFVIPPVELLVGILITLGLLLRPVLAAGTLLMFLLTFGSCLLQRWSIVSEQLLYMAFYARLFAFARFNRFSFDTWRKPPHL